MARTVHVIYNFKDKKEAEWESLNPVLGPQEPGVVNDGPKKGFYKLGDGHTRWKDLLYYQPINPNGASDPELEAHIHSENPHPEYDDGSDLLLLYENAKV